MGAQEQHWTVFLSYCKEDQLFANWIHQKLLKANITVWYDQIEIHTGQDILLKIAEGVKGSDFLLVVLSEAAMKSSWVRTELITKVYPHIQREEVTILPIVLGDVDPEEINRYLEKTFLANKKWLPFPQGKPTRAFNKVFAQLQQDIEWYIQERKQSAIDSATNQDLTKPAEFNHQIQQSVADIQKSMIQQNLIKSDEALSISEDNIKFTDSILSQDTERASMRQPSDIDPSDIDRIVDILAKLAANSLGRDGPIKFFQSLVARATLPERWKRDIAGTWTGNANNDARDLVNWSLSKGVNREDAKFTTLGSILNILLRDEVGLDDASTIVAFIHVYKLYQDKRELENLAKRYQIPVAAPQKEQKVDIGPEITWLGPEDRELHNFLESDPPVLDVGFLSRAIQRAASVCRVEIPQKSRQGTGFLIADDLLLTNYHVLKMYENDDIDENAREAIIRFGCITSVDGKEAKGQIFKLVTSKPILEKSPIDELDYVLLHVQDSIAQNKNIIPATYDHQHPPDKGAGMHILQHPDGEPMKVAISSNGVTGVYPERGLVQYVTKASAGSSGAPCFNDEWNLVALHHAQRSRYFGSIREGILFISIYEKIKRYLHL